MASARRSERLRRRRMATPGLSQPGTYSMYGGGYVVESEASLAPSASQLPISGVTSRAEDDSRRVRYRDSPHRPMYDVSDDTAGDDGDGPPNRRNSLMDRVRISLFDVLGSASRRPVNTNWRPAGVPANGDDDFDNDELVPEPDMDGDLGHAGADGIARRLLRSLRRSRKVLSRWVASPDMPLVLLAIMLLLGLGLLSMLDTRSRPDVTATSLRRLADLRSSSAGIDFRHAPFALASALCDGSVAVARSIRSGAVGAGQAVKQSGSALISGAAVVLRFLFRGAWPDRSRRAGDFLSREELKEFIIPEIMGEARRVAAEEAAKVSRDFNPSGTASGWGIVRDDFARYSERYAADKGLPADYALLSAGASVIKSEPSSGRMYVRFARNYAQALVRSGVYTPTLPLRPRVALTPDVLPGNCWAFPGSSGSMTVRLARPVVPTSVTLEHTPPSSVFSTSSAPRRFRVTALAANATIGVDADKKTVILGEYEFDLSPNRRHLQSFVIAPGLPVPLTRAVRIDFLSNHGAPHTCVYRVRIHGNESGDEPTLQ